MKHTIQATGLIVVAVAFTMLLASAALAQTLTIPWSFSNGTPADATKVNANFGAVKTTVDAHNTAIAGKQADLYQSCAVGYAIRVVNNDGSVTCQKVETGTGITSATALEGVPRYSSFATQQTGGGGGTGRSGTTTGAGTDYLVVPIHLPHGATITKFHYRVYDNSTTYYSNAYLYATGATAFSISSVGTGTAEASTSVLLKSSGTLSVTVDNYNYAYFAYMYIKGGTDATLIVPMSVHVEYSY